MSKRIDYKFNEDKYLTELKKTDKVGDNNLVDLLRFYQLVNEIQVANGIQV